MTEQRKPVTFQIIKDDPTDGHGGYGIGAISLENVAPLILDVDDQTVEIDVGAMHAKSAVEKGIKWGSEEEVPNGRKYFIVWVAVERGAEGTYYAGVTACPMWIDREARRGFKRLPEHVNLLDRALKRKIILDALDAKSKATLRAFLEAHDAGMWARASKELKEN
ncbi:MAG: YwhD family protein [Bacilli bacterium]